MGRGLDGYFCPSLALCGSQAPPGAVSQDFRWRIAKGKHLFPFRTEQLSLSAPMVLGGQPPGRVGRRRFFLEHEPGHLAGLVALLECSPVGPPACTVSPPAKNACTRRS